MYRLFVQQLKLVLDAPPSSRYSADDYCKSIRRATMNRTRVLALGAMLIFALTAAAQQPSSGAQQPSSAGAVHDPHAMPTAESHLKDLAEKLDLTTDQQMKARPIVQELHDASLKIAQNDSLSHEERTNRFRPIYEKADKQLREILNDEQKKKLDQLEQERHPELHSKVN
jgi:Spy/CpxP family protein refolding chaperone